MSNRTLSTCQSACPLRSGCRPPALPLQARSQRLWHTGFVEWPNNSLQATTPAAFTSARFARLRFGLRLLRLSSMPLAGAGTFSGERDRTTRRRYCGLLSASPRHRL